MSMIGAMVAVLICWVQGLQNKECAGLYTFKLAWEHLDPSPGWELFVSDASEWGMCSLLMESSWWELGCLGLFVVRSPLQRYGHCLTLLLVTVHLCLMVKGRSWHWESITPTSTESATYWPFPLVGLNSACLRHHVPNCPSCSQPWSLLHKG